ncbi:acylphosphatase-2-like, partial [Plectropomus leopardus]|uniref:acylphosphatase-2-like n=1 Tax=Plectropomus leopardus TaxID=160734 RepID=UPI001C4D4CAA
RKTCPCWCRAVKRERAQRGSPALYPALLLKGQFLFSLRMSKGDSAGTELVSVDFEIFGHVQGVCFRMYTEKQGLQLGLVGWVKNTYGGTVVGQVQGPADMVEEM